MLGQLRLLGNYTFQIDAKGRVSLPSAYRRVLSADQLVLLLRPTHLDLYPKETWATVYKRLLKQDDSGMLVRSVTFNAAEVDPDAHGRIRVPAGLLKKAGLKGTVVFLGALDRVELWDPARLDEHLKELHEYDDETLEDIFKPTGGDEE